MSIHLEGQAATGTADATGVALEPFLAPIPANELIMSRRQSFAGSGPIQPQPPRPCKDHPGAEH